MKRGNTDRRLRLSRSRRAERHLASAGTDLEPSRSSAVAALPPPPPPPPSAFAEPSAPLRRAGAAQARPDGFMKKLWGFLVAPWTPPESGSSVTDRWWPAPSAAASNGPEATPAARTVEYSRRPYHNVPIDWTAYAAAVLDPYADTAAEPDACTAALGLDADIAVDPYADSDADFDRDTAELDVEGVDSDCDADIAVDPYADSDADCDPDIATELYVGGMDSDLDAARERIDGHAGPPPAAHTGDAELGTCADPAETGLESGAVSPDTTTDDHTGSAPRTQPPSPVRSRRNNASTADAINAATSRAVNMPPDISGGHIWMSAGALREIAETVGVLPAERGGPLAGDRRSGIVTHFHLDAGGRFSAITYSPGVRRLNKLLKKVWNPADISLLGFIHSHPVGISCPSPGDRSYAADILAAIPDMDRMLLPIAHSEADLGHYVVAPYTAHREPQTTSGQRLAALSASDPYADVRAEEIRVVPDSGPLAREESGHPAFERVRSAYDLPALASTRVVIVGIGGGAAYAEALTRCGVGEIVLVDPDIVEEQNIATQQTYLTDIGRPKVAALAQRLLQVSPSVQVATVQAAVQDITHTTLRALLHRPMPGSAFFPAKACCARSPTTSGRKQRSLGCR